MAKHKHSLDWERFAFDLRITRAARQLTMREVADACGSPTPSSVLRAMSGTETVTADLFVALCAWMYSDPRSYLLGNK